MTKLDDRIVALEHENAELRRQLDEALDQQTATAEVLQVINLSPGDLAPVFDAMLDKAMRLCEAAFGQLTTYDGERFRTAATLGVPAAFAEFRSRNPPDYGPGTAPARILAGERLVHIGDVKAEEAYRAGEPNRRALVDLGGARTSLVVPLRKDDAVLGFINIYRQEVRPFSNREIALLQNFAAQAVIAMENARLLTETREALEQQTATAEVLGVINSSPGDLAPVFDAMLEKAMRLCDAPCAILWLYEGNSFRPAAVLGVPQAFAEYLRQPQNEPPLWSLDAISRGEPFVHTLDLSATETYRRGDYALNRAVVDLGGARTGLLVPLARDGTLIGAIRIYRHEVRPFTDQQIALLQNFAAQAVIAIENARLITETREALDQQTATAEVLGVINSSPGDLAPVFDAMLERAMRLCGAELSHFMQYDGSHFHTLTLRGASPDYAEFMSRPLAPGETGGSLAALVRGEAIAHVPDLMDSEAYRSLNPARRALVDLGRARTGIWIALRNEAGLRGALVLYRTEVRPFTDKQIALLQNFAAQAVIAMENARLLTETREALEQQTATAEVLQVINASPGDLAPVFDAMLEKATRLCEAAFGVLNTYDGERFQTGATLHVPSAYAAYRAENPHTYGPGTFPRRILGGERLIHIVDLTAEETYRNGDVGRRALVEVGSARTCLVAALVKDETVCGFITVYRREVRPFTDKQIALLQNFAAQAVIAIENARLLRELRQRTEEVAELNRGLEARVAEQVEELGRVGRLKRFLAPQLAELIVSHGDEKILESHRREIVVVFCDLRGYTAFTETAEPEEVLDFLREYHGALGPLVAEFEGTLDQFSGDGIMVFFNDPVPIPDPGQSAVRMAMAMREAAGGLTAAWRRRGRELGFGVGIAQGYATLGQIGFAERSGYTAIGTVCNVAARLCAEAKDAQILLSQRVAAGLDGGVALEEIGALALKGLTQPVIAYNATETASPASRLKLV